MSSILLTPAARQTLLGHYRRSADPNVRVLSRPWSTRRRTAQVPDGESALVQRMAELATQYGRCSYHRERHCCGLCGGGSTTSGSSGGGRGGRCRPGRRPSGRLWLNDGSCVRLRPADPGHVGSYDFVACRTSDGRAPRLTRGEYRPALDTLAALGHLAYPGVAATGAPRWARCTRRLACAGRPMPRTASSRPAWWWILLEPSRKANDNAKPGGRGPSQSKAHPRARPSVFQPSLLKSAGLSPPR
jgi:hypothetical protein